MHRLMCQRAGTGSPFPLYRQKLTTDRDILKRTREGASRYNIKGETCGIVTKEEEEAARKILAAL